VNRSCRSLLSFCQERHEDISIPRHTGRRVNHVSAAIEQSVQRQGGSSEMVVLVVLLVRIDFSLSLRIETRTNPTLSAVRV
jgi:hypothetical protein